MKKRIPTLLLRLMCLATWYSSVEAQQAAFVWGFNNWTSTTLPQCAPLDIFTDGTKGTVTPTPPFYIIAYEPGALPTVDNVGNTEGSLVWTVDHAAGKQLIMSMVDANGNSGGVLSDIYNIAGDTSSGNSSCLPSTPSTPSITAKLNSTANNIDTCSSLQLSITGGSKPYTVTVAERNTAFSFNTTLGGSDDTYIWVNNLSPGGSVILAVSDSKNTYAPTSPIFTLSGSSDTHCNTQSHFFDSSNPNPSSSGSSSKVATIGGAVAAVAVIVILGLIAWFILSKRRQRRHARPEKGWVIDHTDERQGNGSPDLGEHEQNERNGQGLTPYVLPPSQNDSGSQLGMLPRRPNSNLDEESYNRDSSYYGTESGYGAFIDGYNNPSDEREPSLSHPLNGGGRGGNGEDPFATHYSNYPTKMARYRDNSPSNSYSPSSAYPTSNSGGGGYPTSPSQSQSQSTPTTQTHFPNPHIHLAPPSASAYSQSTSQPTFRPTNPDHHDASNPWQESRDRKSSPSELIPVGQRRSTGEVRVFQHQDAGEPVEVVEEIPPAYPGPGGGSGR